MRAVVLLLLALLGLASAVDVGHTTRITGRKDPQGDKVLIEMFVMSRCPDAQFTEAYFMEVMQRVHNIARLELHFIQDGRGPTITCKHGEPECTGNKQQLCVQDKCPGAENWQSFIPFVQCMNQSPIEIGTLPLAEKCLAALPRTIADPARSCMTGPEGEALTRGDAEYTLRMGATRSCTIFINGQKRCIRDGGKWYDCPDGYQVQDFVASICNAYWDLTGAWPAAECGDESAHGRVAHTNLGVAATRLHNRKLV